jgi:hypothetical protein
VFGGDGGEQFGVHGRAPSVSSRARPSAGHAF